MGFSTIKFMGIDVEQVGTRYGRLLVPVRDQVIGRSLRVYGEWAEEEIRFISALLNEHDIVLDIGANIGTHTIALASRFPKIQIFAFEPQPLLHALLVSNVLSAGFANVTPMAMGCSSNITLIDVNPDYDAIDWNFGAVALTESPFAQGSYAAPVTMIPIDSLVFQSRVQLLKIDVEGMEKEVLSGAVSLLTSDRPLVFFEILTIEKLQPVKQIMSRSGYDMYWIETPAFNPRNYNGNMQNIWGEGETSILAIPQDSIIERPKLDLVTGSEITIPRKKYRTY